MSNNKKKKKRKKRKKRKSKTPVQKKENKTKNLKRKRTWKEKFPKKKRRKVIPIITFDDNDDDCNDEIVETNHQKNLETLLNTMSTVKETRKLNGTYNKTINHKSLLHDEVNNNFNIKGKTSRFFKTFENEEYEKSIRNEKNEFHSIELIEQNWNKFLNDYSNCKRDGFKYSKDDLMIRAVEMGKLMIMKLTSFKKYTKKRIIDCSESICQKKTSEIFNYFLNIYSAPGEFIKPLNEKGDGFLGNKMFSKS